MKCEKNHKNQKDIIYLGDILINEEDISNETEKLNEYINKLNKEIDNIIKILNNVRIGMKEYFDLIKFISNNYNSENINHQILQNLSEIRKNYDVIKNDINLIANKIHIDKKFNKIIEIYNKMNNKIVDNNNIKKNGIIIQAISEIFLMPNIKKINLERGNIKQMVDSIKIDNKLNEEFKIESISKFSLLLKEFSQEKEDYIQTDPQYLESRPDEIDIKEEASDKFDFFFFSEKDNNPYLILSFENFFCKSMYS